MSVSCQTIFSTFSNRSFYLCTAFQKRVKMKRTVLLFSSLCLLLTLQAQQVTDSVTLGEVVVESARVTKTVDGLRYYPSEALREHSSDAWQLLRSLALPALTVDAVNHTVAGPPLQGSVQIRINDVVASHEDLLALNPADIEHVDYTDHPGVRHGQDVGYVINITARRPTQGYEVGTEATVSSMRWMADGSLYGKVNRGASEWQLSTAASLQEFRHLSQTEEAVYHFSDGTTANVLRSDTPDSRRQRSQNQQLALRYSYVLPQRLTLQASLRAAFEQMPRSEASVLTEGLPSSPAFTAPTTHRSHSVTPALDLYASVRLSPRQTLQANVVGTLIRSHYNYAYEGQNPFAYATCGTTHTLQGEAVYEHRLKPFTLSVGLNFLQKRAENAYTADAATDESIRQSDQRLFAQLRGTLGRLGYKAGLDLYHQYVRIATAEQSRWTVGPRLSLSLPVGEWRMAYDGFCHTRQPRLEYRTGVAVRQNELDVNVGNPDLHSEQFWQHRLSLSHQSPRLFTETSAALRDIINPYMTRTEQQGDHFVTWRENQRRIRMFWATEYVQWQAIPDRLQLASNVGLYRMLNDGNDYFHALTFFNCSFDATLMLGHFSFVAHYDNGWHFVENEYEGRQAGTFYVGGNATLGNVSLGLYWQHPLCHSVRTDENFGLNRYVQRHLVQTSTETASLLNLTITWRLSHGRRYADVQRSINLSDTDSGIVRQK